jgi:phosphoserine aminotransferase
MKKNMIFGIQNTTYASIRVNNVLFKRCMNLLFLPERYHISILDGGADSFILGRGWNVIYTHKTRRSNVVDFDHETAIKQNHPIVIAITAIDLSEEKSILPVIHEGIYNETSNHTILSEFQL